MKNMRLTKFDVARRQLRSAIRLFFLDSDPVSIETLAGAANGVLRGMAVGRNVQSYLHDSDLIKPEFRKEWFNFLHESQNFFKHADRDADALLEFNPEWVKFVLLETCHLFRNLAAHKDFKQRQLKEAILYELWFSLAYPQYLIDPTKFHNLLTRFNIRHTKATDFDVFLMVLGIEGNRI